MEACWKTVFYFGGHVAIGKQFPRNGTLCLWLLYLVTPIVTISCVCTRILWLPLWRYHVFVLRNSTRSTLNKRLQPYKAFSSLTRACYSISPAVMMFETTACHSSWSPPHGVWGTKGAAYTSPTSRQSLWYTNHFAIMWMWNCVARDVQTHIESTADASNGGNTSDALNEGNTSDDSQRLIDQQCSLCPLWWLLSEFHPASNIHQWPAQWPAQRMDHSQKGTPCGNVGLANWKA